MLCGKAPVDEAHGSGTCSPSIHLIAKATVKAFLSMRNRGSVGIAQGTVLSFLF
jgi:hypothetical protein